MDFYIGNTDWNWFSYLKALHPAPEDINFWKPSAANFTAIPLGAPFLLRLKSPVYKIAGVGFFMGYSRLPLSMAWEAFGDRNGCDSLLTLTQQIVNYRSKMGIVSERDPEIGCIALTDPILFDEKDWIDSPEDWKSNIVSGKTYSAASTIGGLLWGQVEAKIHAYRLLRTLNEVKQRPVIAEHAARDAPPIWPGYGPTAEYRPRIGQGAFRILVTNAYQHRCAVTSESVINVLEAAHIQDFSKQGPHAVNNGLLMRADLHKLFDAGLITVTPDLRVELAKSTQEQYALTSGYLALHGQRLANLPKNSRDHPSPQFLSWHNQNQFKG